MLQRVLLTYSIEILDEPVPEFFLDTVLEDQWEEILEGYLSCYVGEDLFSIETYGEVMLTYEVSSTTDLNKTSSDLELQIKCAVNKMVKEYKMEKLLELYRQMVYYEKHWEEQNHWRQPRWEQNYHRVTRVFGYLIKRVIRRV